MLISFAGIPVPLSRIGECPTQLFYTLHKGTGADNIIPLIPTFPDFKIIEWSDRKEIEDHSKRFLPYSDFNFTSLFAWNVDDVMRASWLNNNLVVLFRDYVTGEKFLSFLGAEAIPETAQILLGYVSNEFSTGSLRLIPQCMADALCPKLFIVIPDRDAFDYINPVESIAQLHLVSNNQSNSARALKRFIKNHPGYSIACTSLLETKLDELVEVYARWGKLKEIDYLNSTEYRAFRRLLNSQHETLYVMRLYIDDRTVGFSLFEIVSSEYSMGHFSKADTAIKGIYEALNWHSGRMLFDRGIRFFNFQQDLGIPNLRSSKARYGAHTFLKKFTVKNIHA